MEVRQPAHTCVDRPHLPCEACRTYTPNQSHLKIEPSDLSKDIARTAFRLGFRACLLLTSPGGLYVTNEKIDEQGRKVLGEEYYQ